MSFEKHRQVELQKEDVKKLFPRKLFIKLEISSLFVIVHFARTVAMKIKFVNSIETWIKNV